MIILAFLALAILCRSVFRSFHTTAVKTKPHPNNGALVLPSAFLIFASYTLICSLDFDPLTAFFPTIISILTLIFLGLVAIAHFALPGFKIWEDEEPANKNAYLGVISFSGSIVMISGVVLLVTLFAILPVALVGVAVFLYCSAETKALLAIGTGIALASILFLLSRGVGAFLPKGLLF